MMHRAEHGRAERPGQRRVLCAAIALGAVATLGVGAVPIAHAAPAAATLSAASPLAAVADADADRAAVQLLKATYFNNVDSKNWLALRRLFAPDAVVDTTGSLGPYFPNRDLFVAFTALTLSAINTRHLGYDPQIELTSDTTAGAVWTMQDRLSLAGLVTIHGYGHYTDSYEKVDGQWRVTHSKLTRTGFELELPAFTNFATGFADAYESGGPVAALLYIVPGLVNIPVSIVQNLLGAIASNFGGPPAKAEPITPPPGSTGVTTDPPGLTNVPPAAATAPPSAKTVTLRTTVAASSGSGATPLATDSVDSTTKPVRTIEADATQTPVEGKPRSSTTTPPEAHDTDTEDATSATETAADTTADEESHTPSTAPAQEDSTGSPSTSHDGAGPGSSDDAKSEAGSSGGSQQ